MEEKSVMLVGVDDSEHSFYALDWVLEKFFAVGSEKSNFKLVVVHARLNALDVLRFPGPGTAAMIPLVERDLDVTAAQVLDKARERCKAKSVTDAIFEVTRGDARNVLCDAVEKHQASILVVGNHGYGVLKRAVLGSVSDHCAHNAHCSVMIVKRPPNIQC